ATSATVLNWVLRYFAFGDGLSGSAPVFNPTTGGALPPVPDAPWQLAQLSANSFCPRATCSANVAGAAPVTAPVGGAEGGGFGGGDEPPQANTKSGTDNATARALKCMVVFLRGRDSSRRARGASGDRPRE